MTNVSASTFSSSDHRQIGFLGSYSEWMRLDSPIKQKLALARVQLSLPEGLWILKQVHSTKVLSPKNDPQMKIEGDGIYLGQEFYQQNLSIGVQTADCLPILGIDPASGAKFALHAGWRGLLGGIIDSACEQVRLDHLSLQNFCVFLGPCISSRKFEVGQDVFEYAMKSQVSLEESMRAKHFTQLNEKWLFNLHGYAIYTLLNLGVDPENISVINDCTYENTQWPSYRRKCHNSINNSNLGRIYSII